MLDWGRRHEVRSTTPGDPEAVVVRYDGSDRADAELRDVLREIALDGRGLAVRVSLSRGVELACALAYCQGDGVSPSRGEVLSQLREEASRTVQSAGRPLSIWNVT
jgi:hypothetical protein